VKLFLGIDGGQSSTTALIGGEDGRVIGVGRAGPCNHAAAAEGREKFARALGACVREALDQAGAIGEIQFECACMGFSGGPADKDALAREIVSAKIYSITHDALIALIGATGGEPGVVTIAGTGSIAFGRNSEGLTARAGGWGYAFGDEGGAFDLVRKALRAALRFEEGWGPPTALRDALLAATGTGITQNTESDTVHDPGSANDLLHRFYTHEFPRARIAAFAALVDEVALAGDAVARDILNEAAQSLATIASAVREQLFAPGEIVTMSHAGGAFRSAMLLERFRMLVELHDGNRVAAPKFGPPAGALIEAYRLAGIKCELDAMPRF
jgi:N-acetylglucosamine kinase-like BadF-type ATPase